MRTWNENTFESLIVGITLFESVDDMILSQITKERGWSHEMCTAAEIPPYTLPLVLETY